MKVFYENSPLVGCFIINFVIQLHSTRQHHKLKLIYGGSSDYECSDKTRLNVKYYVLSDESLSFVKVKLPGQP